MQYSSPIILAYHLSEAADELKHRAASRPCHMERTLEIARYLDDLTRGISGQPLYAAKLNYTDRRAYAAFRRILVGTNGYFAFERSVFRVREDDVLDALAWFGQELLFLSQRGYKLHVHEIITFRDFFCSTILHIADTPQLRAWLNGEK